MIEWSGEQAQTGLKLPHEEEGLVGSLGVLRRFGAAEGASGPWAALGGSLLWDARQRKLAALQVAACAELSPSQLVCLGVDQTGALTGSVRSTVDSFTLLASASVDLSRRAGLCRPVPDFVFPCDELWLLPHAGAKARGSGST